MRRNRVFAAMLAVLMVVSLTACGRESVGTPDGELENGVAAIEDAMTTKPSGNSSTPTEPIDDLRDGSSADTVATPNDFPAAYNYGSGFIDYVAEHGGKYTLELSEKFAQQQSGGATVPYDNPIAVKRNDGWRYAYGNMFYAKLVNQHLVR